MKKIILVILCTIFLVTGFTGCTANSKQPQNTPILSNSDTTKNYTTADGTYVGQIDNNSIEVNINNKATALFFSDEVKKDFNPSSFKKGNKVQVTYYKNDKNQLILTSIKISK